MYMHVTAEKQYTIAEKREWEDSMCVNELASVEINFVKLGGST